MIKLERGKKPVELTTALQKKLTDEYKSTKNSVWNIKFLKDSLLAMSNNKCCYCETDISEESKYLEVEHFHHKDKYKDEVLEWDNLLPSCKRCNGVKGSHDTVLEPIVNPVIDNPKEHLKFWNFRIKAIGSLGAMTISSLSLNDQDRLVKKRFDIGNAIHEKLEMLNELMDEYASGIQTSTLRRNRITNGLKELLREGLPSSIYSATCSTTILNDKEFISLKSKLAKAGFWDAQLTDLEKEIGKTSFDLDI